MNGLLERFTHRAQRAPAEMVGEPIRGVDVPLPLGAEQITTPLSFGILQTGEKTYALKSDRDISERVKLGDVEIWQVPAEAVTPIYTGEKTGFHEALTKNGTQVDPGKIAVQKDSTLVIVRQRSGPGWADASLRVPLPTASGHSIDSIWTTDMVVLASGDTKVIATDVPKGFRAAVLPLQTQIPGRKELSQTPIMINGQGYEQSFRGANTIVSEAMPERLGAYWRIAIENGATEGALSLTSLQLPIPGNKLNTYKQRPFACWQLNSDGSHELVQRLITPELVTAKVLVGADGQPLLTYDENLLTLFQQGKIGEGAYQNLRRDGREVTVDDWRVIQELLMRGDIRTGAYQPDQLAYTDPLHQQTKINIQTGKRYVFTNGKGGPDTRVLLSLQVASIDGSGRIMAVMLGNSDPGKLASTSSGTQLIYGFEPKPPETKSTGKGQAYIGDSREFQHKTIFDGRD